MAVQFFTLSLSSLYETNEQQLAESMFLSTSEISQNGRNLAFLWSMREKTKKIVGERKLLYETNELQFFLVYILIDHRNDQKWLQLSISMVDKREDLENCCREKVIVRNKPTTATPWSIISRQICARKIANSV